jgi:hypothetical protein
MLADQEELMPATAAELAAREEHQMVTRQAVVAAQLDILEMVAQHQEDQVQVVVALRV